MNDPDLDQAYAARQSGDDARAADICRRLLEADAGDLGARSLLAVCMAEAGEAERARPLAEEAAGAEPDNWRFLINLSVVRQLAGDIEAAADCARKAISAAPERFETWGRLGDLLGAQGEFEEAVTALEKASELNPGHAGLALRLAGAAYETGALETCAHALDRFEHVAPGHPEALRLRTHLARRRNDAEAFAEAASRWFAADPSSDGARVALASAHAQRDDYHRAIELYHPLVQAHPQDADHAATFAQYQLWSRDFEGAERSYNRALVLRPGHTDAAAGLARLNVYRGKFAEAVTLARQALETDPAHVEAYAQLVLASGGRLSDAELEQLRTVAGDSSVPSDHRAIAWFAVGDVHHRRKEHEPAFEAWQQANELKRATSELSERTRYDRRKTEELVDRLAACFSELPPRILPDETDGPTPIFVVGMPRSGTTLLDSALGSHPRVSSGGELPALPAFLDQFLAWADRAGWTGGAIPDVVTQRLRDAYLRQYETYRIPRADFVVDKQPQNFLAVGLIRHLFPAAPVIHIRRNALETGFSIYRKNFTRSWPFSTSLEDIGHYYGQYARLVAHWDAVPGDAMTTVRYEQLVRDFETELRRLVDYIGLEWDPRCLSFHEQDSVVTTLSSTQIRKGPSTDHIDSTSPYAAWLKPLKDTLDKAGVDSG